MQIRTGTARSGDLDIYYEDIGDTDDPAVLLIMGLGSQLLLWRDGFCQKLVDAGYRVIRYDNRDVGLSSKTERRKVGRRSDPEPGQVLDRTAQRRGLPAGRHGRGRRRRA